MSPEAVAAAPRPLTICAVGYAESVHVATRVRWFAERGHNVFIITESPSPHGIEGVRELVPGIDPGLAGRWWFRALMAGCRKLAGPAADHVWRAAVFVGALRRCRPDVVHVHFAYSYYGWLAGVLGCRPLVVTVMGGDVLFEEQGEPTPIGKFLTLELLRKADYITSKSHYLTAILDRLGGFGGKTERIVWGISVDRFRRVDAGELRRRLGLSPLRRVILSPKILQPLYRVHLVVEAMALVRRRCPEAVLLVTEYAPDPGYRAEIARRVDELDLGDHVVFCGRVQHADMPTYYSLAEIAVAVPSSDGLPQTLLESMACGTPNILSRLPRYEEIVQHRDSAYFVEPNPAEIAAGMLCLLEDSGLRAAIAGRARDIVRAEADLDQQAARVERRYRDLVARGRPRIVRAAALLAAWRSYRQYRSARAELAGIVKAHP